MTRSAEIPLNAAVARNLMDIATVGIVLLSNTEVVTWTNTRADRILDRGDRLRVVDGQLTAATPRGARELRKGLEAALRNQCAAQFVRLSDDLGRDPLELLICLIAGDVLLEPLPLPVLAVLLSDPDHRPQLSPRALEGMYGLTPAEARIAASLVAGWSVRRIAAELEIQANTVRVHLKSIYAKTGTSGQADLVRRLLCGLAGVGCFAHDPGTEPGGR